MLKRIVRSPRTYFLLAAVLLIVAALSRVVHIHIPARPRGDIEDLASLRERKLNVVFVLVDTLRADRLSAYGYERLTSRYLTDAASVGILFRHNLAQSSWTKSSMASIWTATYPNLHGVTRFSDGLPEELKLPAEIFQEAGYRTVGLYRNGWVAPNFGFSQGFDQYQNPMPSWTPEKLEKRTASSYKLSGSDQSVTESAIAFLNGAGNDEPFFLYLHYMDVHQYVYDDTSDFGVTFSDYYDNSISWVDKNFGAVLYELDKLKLSKNTIVVFAADHGEAFMEHGTEGHARNLYHEVTETPFVIALPFRLPKGLVVEEWVQNVDIWPTILDMLGLPPLPGAQGKSLLPLIYATARGEPTPAEFLNRPGFAYLDRTWGSDRARPDPLISATHDAHRLIVPMCFHERAELYDLAKDRAEKRNLAYRAPRIRESLTERLLGFFALPDTGFAATENEVDALTRGQLLALGYVLDDNERAKMHGPDGKDPRGCDAPRLPELNGAATEAETSEDAIEPDVLDFYTK